MKETTKTPDVFNKTLTYEELTTYILNTEKTYSDIISVSSLGKSNEGRDIWQVTIGSFLQGNVHDKPAFYIDANIHALESAGSVACLAFIETICNRRKEKEIMELINRVTFYIVPRVSPDGAEHYIQTGKYLRSSPQLYPHQEFPDGLQQEDLDNDGIIAQMRIEDPFGRWKESSIDRRIMIKRSPNDKDGPFYHLYPEGIIHNFDGIIHEGKPPHGLDFNRNFPVNWKRESEQKGSGKYPLSETETRSVANFINQHTNIAFFIALHTGIEVLIPPEGARPFSEFSNNDKALFHQLGSIAKNTLKMPMESLFANDYGKIYGDFGEWLYEHYGIPGFIAEIWSPSARAGVSLKDEIHAGLGFINSEEIEVATAKWLDENSDKKHLRNWHSYNHHQLGKIEIGGWEQGIFQVAPDGNILQDISKRFVEYILETAYCLPFLDIYKLSIKHLEGSLYHVTVIVQNKGMLPTNLTQIAIDNNIAESVEVKIELPQSCEKIIGKRRQDIGHLDGYGGMGKAEWLIRAESITSEFSIIIDGKRAGILKKAVKISEHNS